MRIETSKEFVNDQRYRIAPRVGRLVESSDLPLAGSSSLTTLDCEPFLANGGRYAHIALRGAASKIDMQIMKLAAILHGQPIDVITHV